MKRLVLLFTVIFNVVTFSQDKEIEFIPGKEYEANFFYKLLFGENWREVWTSNAKAKVLDLETFSGGLTPIRALENVNTQSLVLKGNDGRVWQFKEFNKDPIDLLPKKFQVFLVKRVVDDLISAAYPYAPVLSEKILSKMGVVSPKYFIVSLPDSPLLKEFRKDFKNKTGYIFLFNEDKKNWNFEVSVPLITTEELYKRLSRNPSKIKVAKLEYLKVRLLDILMGDWESNFNLWNWAEYEDLKGNMVWHPIPHSRFKAFTRFDGLFTRFFSYYVPQIENFKDEYSSVENITFNGRFLDRRLLSGIDKAKWDSVTNFITKNLDDEFIRKLSDEIPVDNKELKDEFAGITISRRNKLNSISEEFYDYINEVVYLWGSDNPDSLFILKEKDKINVDLYSGESLIFNYEFNDSVTNELRVFLLDGDDVVKIVGDSKQDIEIKIVGGEGNDIIYDQSYSKGNALGFLPFDTFKNMNYFYDENKENILTNSSTKFRYLPDSLTSSFEFNYRPLIKQRGESFALLPVFHYTSDDGMYIGAAPQFTKYGFLNKPFKIRIKPSIYYTLKAKTLSYDLDVKVKQVFYKLDLNFKASHSELIFNRFYGIGNETPYSSTLEDAGYYDVGKEIISINPEIVWNIDEELKLGLGFSWENVKFNPDEKILKEYKNRIKGIAEYWLFGTHLNFSYDSRDNKLMPFKGTYIKAFFSGYPDFGYYRDRFYKVGLDYRIYKPLGYKTTLAFRIGGENVWGDYPFFHAALVGGRDNLRGYSRNRFAGDASLFNQTELRLYLFDFSIVLNSEVGILAFHDIGRVFDRERANDKWHNGFGFGVWTTSLSGKLNISLTYSKSKERGAFYLSNKFLF